MPGELHHGEDEVARTGVLDRIGKLVLHSRDHRRLMSRGDPPISHLLHAWVNQVFGRGTGWRTHWGGGGVQPGGHPLVTGVDGNRTHWERCSHPPLVLKTRAGTSRANTPPWGSPPAASAWPPERRPTDSGMLRPRFPPSSIARNIRSRFGKRLPSWVSSHREPRTRGRIPLARVHRIFIRTPREIHFSREANQY